jgi:hypothetical protein
MYVIAAAKVFFDGLHKGNAKRQNEKVTKSIVLENVEPQREFMRQAKIIRNGKAALIRGVGFDTMVTWFRVVSWSIVLSWKSISDAILNLTKRFITSTAIKETIALKTYKFAVANMARARFKNVRTAARLTSSALPSDTIASGG